MAKINVSIVDMMLDTRTQVLQEIRQQIDF
jgi:hypothetical protein